MEEERNKNGEEKRVHAWVLVRAGRRDIKEHVFVESSTGRVYTVKNCPYIGIESLWNHANFYANTKVDSKVSEVTLFFLLCSFIFHNFSFSVGFQFRKSRQSLGGFVSE
jgi:hypothetical protein